MPSPVLVSLESTSVAVEVVEVDANHFSGIGPGPIQRIEIEYSFVTDRNETFVHLYEFFTEEYEDEDGYPWREFIDLLIRQGENEGALVRFVRYHGGVMRDFVDLCCCDKQHAKAA